MGDILPFARSVPPIRFERLYWPKSDTHNNSSSEGLLCQLRGEGFTLTPPAVELIEELADTGLFNSMDQDFVLLEPSKGLGLPGLTSILRVLQEAPLRGLQYCNPLAVIGRALQSPGSINNRREYHIGMEPVRNRYLTFMRRSSLSRIVHVCAQPVSVSGVHRGDTTWIFGAPFER